MGLGKIARRTALGLLAVSGGAIALGAWRVLTPHPNPLEANLSGGERAFTPYILFGADGQITLITPRTELGQGSHTTLAALVAEELDVRLDQVKIHHGPVSPAYGNTAVLEGAAPVSPFAEGVLADAVWAGMGLTGALLPLQVTGGSSSIVDGFETMRAAGASAREMFRATAARRWSVPVDTLTTADGVVTNSRTGETLPYADLVAEADPADLRDVPVRPVARWRLLGRPAPKTYLREKITGAPIYGIDMELPGMVHATVKLSPVFGKGAVRTPDTSAALAVPGVRAVTALDTPAGKGFAIIADHTWAAFEGAGALEVEWDRPDYPGTVAEQQAVLAERLDGRPSQSLHATGDADTVIAEAPQADRFEAVYTAPMLAHATLEPMNATAWLRDGTLDIWSGTQVPSLAQFAAARATGLSMADVNIHVLPAGGGFGRRLETDFTTFAALVARETGGRPVKLTMSREQDTTGDVYRPPARSHVAAKIVRGDLAEAMRVEIAAPSILRSTLERTLPGAPFLGPDATLTEGAFNQPVSIPNFAVSGYDTDLGIPVGFWRSVGHTHAAFALDTALDEMARASDVDPLAYRKLVLGTDPRFEPGQGVLDAVAEMCEWSRPRSTGQGLGLSHVYSYGTWCAMAVEVDASDPLQITLSSVWIAADPGHILDPAIVTDQLSGGAIFGLSAAMNEQITLEEGRVVEQNFYDIPLLTQAQCPGIEVSLRAHGGEIGGIGEVATSPAAPALGNAIFAATGLRLRDLPFSGQVGFAF